MKQRPVVVSGFCIKKESATNMQKGLFGFIFDVMGVQCAEFIYLAHQFWPLPAVCRPFITRQASAAVGGQSIIS
jgi:hypothetical protein